MKCPLQGDVEISAMGVLELFVVIEDLAAARLCDHREWFGVRHSGSGFCSRSG